jgi:uncharacterized protein YndB with AHSA1/START domain
MTMFTTLFFTIALQSGFIAKPGTQNNDTMQSINHQAPVQCSKTILIKAQPEKVWKILTDINHWADWQTDISQPQLKRELAPSATFVWKTGGAKITSTLHTVEPFSKFGWTGKTFGLYAIHNWSITEIDGQTQVAVEESMEGFLAGLLKKSFNKNLEKGMVHWLELLKKTSEQ